MVGALLVLCVAEVPIAHHLLDRFVAPGAAWLATLVTAYGIAWLWGDAQALRQHPTTVERGVLHLRIGLRWQATIPCHTIEAVVRTQEPAEADLSLLGPPNVRLVLSEPVTLRGPLGVARTARELTLQIDDPAAFEQALRP